MSPEKYKDEELEADTLYVVGGMYGNLQALAEIERLAAEERPRAVVVFNGDFNFFNAHPDDFHKVNTAIRERYHATAGNIEFEISSENHGNGGCGCGYPTEYVSEATVTRSDQITARLGQTASKADPQVLEWLHGLPRFNVVRVGGTRCAIIHGDPDSLAGWTLAVERLLPLDAQLRHALGCPSHLFTPTEAVEGWFKAAQVDAFLSTHTCLPFAQMFPGAGRGGGSGVVFNNGAAGLPNFEGSRYGLITRVSTSLSPPPHSLYGCTLPSSSPSSPPVRFDCIPVHYDHEAFLSRFLSLWPAGSAAHQSYMPRILHGPADFSLLNADRLPLPA